MSKKDIFGDEENSKPMDFETMLNQSLQGSRRVKVGDMIRGEILSIGREQAFISTGTPTDGAIPILELMDEKKVVQFKVGDTIEARVLRMREGEILLRRDGAKACRAVRHQLQEVRVRPLLTCAGCRTQTMI